jgi:POT family proton-dependent oligopeptide transporter
MGLSVVSKLAPPRWGGLLMGGWFVATSVGVYLAGFLGMFWGEWRHSTFFFVLVGSSTGAALILLAVMRKLEAALPAEGPAPKLPTPEPEPREPALR